jgi:hypothetical protein
MHHQLTHPLALSLLFLFNACGPQVQSTSEVSQMDSYADSEVHPDSRTWMPLFTEDLSNATFPEGIWTFQDGVLTASADKCIWTKVSYDNFVLDLEFQTAEGTNSGVIVYTSDTENWVPNSVEIQIADDHSKKWAKADKTWQCAAIFGHKAANESRVKLPGEWNRFTITCLDSQITVALNGKIVNEIDLTEFTSAKTNPDGSEIPPWLSNPLASLPTHGHIGLQGKHASAPIYFRNLRLKPTEP